MDGLWCGQQWRQHGQSKRPSDGPATSAAPIMKLIVRDDKASCGEFAASYVRDRINSFSPTAARPFVLGLPTGSTPIPTYRKLVEYVAAGTLSFKHVITFNMDEYVGLPVEHPESYHSFMYTHLFNHVDIPKENINILDGNAADLEQECTRCARQSQKLLRHTVRWHCALWTI